MGGRPGCVTTAAGAGCEVGASWGLGTRRAGLVDIADNNVIAHMRLGQLDDLLQSGGQAGRRLCSAGAAAAADRPDNNGGDPGDNPSFTVGKGLFHDRWDLDFDTPPLHRRYAGEGELVFACKNCGYKMPDREVGVKFSTP